MALLAEAETRIDRHMRCADRAAPCAARRTAAYAEFASSVLRGATAAVVLEGAAVLCVRYTAHDGAVALLRVEP
jgi:hypothetical protein